MNKNSKRSGKERFRKESPTSGSSAPSREKNQEPFVFKDRSGKVHNIGGKRGHEAPASRHERSLHEKLSKRAEKAGGTERGPDRRPERRPEPKRDRERTRDRETVATKLKATVDKNRKGFAFLAFEDRSYEDAFLPPGETDGLFHGDRVEVTLNSRSEIESIDVLSHRFREITGKFMDGWIIYEKKKSREEVYLPTLGDFRPQEGDWVRTKLIFPENRNGRVTGEIIEVYGAELPARADIMMIANEYDLVEEHPEEAEREAREQKLEVPGKDLEGRVDLRELPLITIDGETARDFDDAVYVERVGQEYLLWVAIADVSHYVTEGSALDQTAQSRGTSVYFPERAFHMLPRALSENLCSLRPNEPRLSMVAKMRYDRNGKRISTELMEAVIQSKRRATYNEIQAEWEKNGKDEDWEFAPQFELYQIIRKMRSDRGSIDFDLPEAELRVDAQGEVISIKNRARVDAHRLIEEFMIAANEGVTEWIRARGWPFVYRVHDFPSRQALEKFQALGSHVGINFDIGDGSPAVMAEWVRQIEGHPAQELLNTALLRSMRQAAYSSIHGIHFGLASEGYTHFTSPIRRYPDLVVHRVLRAALRAEKGLQKGLNDQTRRDLEENLEAVCEHCSYRERLASDAERDSIKLKQVRLLSRHLGEEFDGKINGMTETGMFVQLFEPFAEGMLPKDSLEDDFYRFDDERLVYIGQRRRKVFRMGDKIRVQVARADVDSRMVDFKLIEVLESISPTWEESGVLDERKSRSRARKGAERSFERPGERKSGRGGDRNREDRKKRKRR